MLHKSLYNFTLNNVKFHDRCSVDRLGGAHLNRPRTLSSYYSRGDLRINKSSVSKNTFLKWKLVDHYSDAMPCNALFQTVRDQSFPTFHFISRGCQSLDFCFVRKRLNFMDFKLWPPVMLQPFEIKSYTFHC